MNPLLPAGALLVASWWLLWRRFPAPARLQSRAQGQLLEILLYADLPNLMLKVLADVLGTSLRLLLALAPLSLLALSLTLLTLFGLRGYCNWRPPVVGERLLVSGPPQAAGKLRLGPGLRLDSQPLAATSSTHWRLLAQSPGAHTIWLEGDRPGWLVVGPAWANLKPRQGRLLVHYPVRDFWWQDRRIEWPLALGLSCLLWFALGLALNSCWLFLVRQDAKSPSRK